MSSPDPVAIRIEDLIVGFEHKPVLDHLWLQVQRGEILGLIGGSGSGKSVLLHAILGLVPKCQGRICIFGVDLDYDAPEDWKSIKRRMGVLFQHGALFSSLSARDNVAFPMREHSQLSDDLVDRLSMLKLEMVGLRAEDAGKFPAQLSGGMIKRVALARALALDPEILILDEPTSGLDTVAARDLCALIKDLHQTLNLTVMMVTHDLQGAVEVCQRLAALAEGKIVAEGDLGSLRASAHPWVRAALSHL